jgi:hypothetical protein
MDKLDFSKNADILVGLDRTQKIDKQMVTNMKKTGILIDAIFGSINIDALMYTQKSNIRTFRVDMKAAMAGEMTTILRTYNMTKDAGKGYINKLPVISPTYIGEKGDIVVDSIANPTEVIGVADGKGHILYDTEEYEVKIKEIEMEIIKQKIEGKKFAEYAKE